MKYFRKDEVVEHPIHKIRNKLGNHLEQIILFGAWALGNDIRGSEYDCLVVVEKVSWTFKEIIDETAGEAPYEYDAVISAFPVSEEKYQNQSYNLLI